ncbi:unnamed protein product [Camellia sinensis]
MYMQQYNEVELSALGMAIATVVTVAEILKNNGFALNLDDNNGTADSAISVARMEAVEWMLKVNAHYGFTALTAILAINYLDRFLSSLHFQRDKPWMIQLAAVTCLSLAAKVEETQVPLLLDLQVEDTKYVFEAKTIQRMELLVLSTLQWRMNPVTPLSFLDHIIRRLGLKTHLHWEFLRRCERLLLSVVADSRFVGYLPSVLAAATMLHVIHQVDPCNSTEYQNQLLGVLNLNREKVKDGYELIRELASNTTSCFNGQQNNPHKRKYQQIPSSPSNVIDASFSSDSSNDSWAGTIWSDKTTKLFYGELGLLKKKDGHRKKVEVEGKSAKNCSQEMIFTPLITHVFLGTVIKGATNLALLRNKTVIDAVRETLYKVEKLKWKVDKMDTKMNLVLRRLNLPIPSFPPRPHPVSGDTSPPPPEDTNWWWR